ncbi:MAG: sulfurtransferase TusA family protein [Sphingomonadales bacterium]
MTTPQTADVTIHTLDVQGLRCPLPVLKAAKVLRGLGPGDELVALATDPMAELDFQHFCTQGGHQFLGVEHGGDGVLTIRIRKGA